jgi:hypothetical protein
MPARSAPFPKLAAILAALVLGACQAGLDPAPAERALPGMVPPAVPAAIDPDACWTQARLTDAAGVAEDRLFAVPCPGATDAHFWSSLQRALAVRGLYAGPVNGIEDEATGDAIRRFQAPLGLDSAILSLDAARHLGLLPWSRAAL